MNKYNRFSSAGVDQSWTDAVTNEVLLKGLDSKAYIHWLEHRSTRIEPIIPQFMHEFTHHWCFNSLVGRALAFLRMRSMYWSIFGNKEQSDSLLSLDLAKFEITKLLYKPISEGLALFAELDTASGHSEVMSTTLTALQLCFSFPLVDEHAKRQPELSLMALLQNTRLRKQFLQNRKTNIYFRPFTGDDAYLPGYLSIKAILARQMHYVNGFHDKDLFLSYLRAFFFKDAKLVNILFSDEKDEITPENLVAKHIQTRFTSISERKDLNELVNDFERKTVGGEDYLETLDQNLAEIQDALEHLNSAIYDLVSSMDKTDEHEKLVIGSIVSNMELRSYLVVAKVPVVVENNDDRWEVVVTTDRSLKFSIETNDLQTGTFANLLVVIPSSAKFLVEAVVTKGKKVYILKTIGSPSKEDIEGITSFLEIHQFTNNIFQMLEDNMISVLEQHWVKVILEKIRKDSKDKINELYATIATLNVSDANLANTKRQLLSDGFGAFIDDDPDIAEALAAMGLANSISNDIGTTSGIASTMGIADESINQVLNSKYTATFPLVFGNDEEVWVLV